VNGQVVGTFALYYTSPRSPIAEELAVVEQGAILAGIAINYLDNQNALKTSEASLRNTQNWQK